MTADLDGELCSMLGEAISRRACLVPPSRSVAQRLRRRLAAGAVVCPFRGMYADSSYWSTLKPDERLCHIVRALSCKHPDWTFCGPTAAVIHGMYVPWRYCTRVHAVSPVESRRRGTREISWHHVGSSQFTMIDGSRVTTFDRTAVDCMRMMPFGDGLGIADSWLRLSNKDRADLVRLVDQLGMGCKGVGEARMTALYADSRSENGGESSARAAMISLGFEVPELQVEFCNPIDDGHVMRVDFFWRTSNETGIAGELDGLVKYTDPTVMSGMDSERVRAKERLRESRLNALGILVMRFSIDDVRDASRFASILNSYGVPKAKSPCEPGPHRRRFEHVRAGGFDLRTFRVYRR